MVHGYIVQALFVNKLRIEIREKIGGDCAIDEFVIVVVAVEVAVAVAVEVEVEVAVEVEVEVLTIVVTILPKNGTLGDGDGNVVPEIT